MKDIIEKILTEEQYEKLMAEILNLMNKGETLIPAGIHNLLNRLPQTNTPGFFGKFSEMWDVSVPQLPVEGNGFRLAFSGFQYDGWIAQLPRPVFQLPDHGGRDALSTERGIDKHSFQLDALRVEWLEAAAGDGGTILISQDDGRKPGNAVIFFVVFLVGVVNAAKFVVELAGEALEIGVVAGGADIFGHRSVIIGRGCEDRYLHVRYAFAVFLPAFGRMF